MSRIVAILDCYTVEPSALGVPPYLSTYVRDAYSALSVSWLDADVRYVTIDDVRWCMNRGAPLVEPPLSDPRTYSATVNREAAVKVLCDAAVVVIVAGDAVPSVHLHAQNARVDEIARAMACVRGRRVLLGSRTAAPHARLRSDRDSYVRLVEQLRWQPIAEIELYRGCTRKRFCSFCNEPVKAATVDFRSVDDVLDEITRLSVAGIRNIRLGEQTCFFSYQHRNVEQIERLLAGAREACPEVEVLHIDNADPLAVASPVGARIAGLVAEYCTEGNCAPMGIETFDPGRGPTKRPPAPRRSCCARLST